MEEVNNIENSDTLPYYQKQEKINELKHKLNNGINGESPPLTQSDEYSSTVTNKNKKN